MTSLLNKVQLKTLVVCATVGGFVSSSVLLWLQRKTDKECDKHPLVIRSKNLLNRNLKAVELIGPPIIYPGQIGYKIITDEETKINIMYMKIPFMGSQLEGYLNVEAIVDPIIKNWEVYTLKAEITTSLRGIELPSRTFLIYRQSHLNDSNYT